MENQENTVSRNQAIHEMLIALRNSTMELSAIKEKSIEQHEQIRKNCQTLCECYNYMWI